MTGLGTMAEMMTVHEAKLVRVDTDLPDDQLALIGCGVTTGAGAALWTARVIRAPVWPSSAVAASGCQRCKVRSSAAPARSSPSTRSRPTRTALKLGATHVVDPGEGDAVEQIRSLTAGRGAEYTFEVVGLLETMRQAYDAAAKAGR